MIKCQVIDPFRVKLAGVETKLNAGQTITLPEDKAVLMIQAGKVIPIGRAAYRIYSNILEAFLWVTEDDTGADELRAEGIKEPIYTGHEIKELKKLSRDDLKAIHEVKTIFEKSKIEDIS